MATKIQLRRDTLVNWLAADPVLMDGEEVLVATNASKPTVYDSKKVGDGTRKFSELELFGYECLPGIGNSQKFPISQKGTTDSLVEIMNQRNNSYLSNIIKDKFEPLELPEFSTWSGYTLTPYFKDGETNGLLQNAPFVHTTQDAWISVPMGLKIKSGATYIGIILDMRMVKGSPNIDAFFDGAPSGTLTVFTTKKTYTAGRRKVFIGYINIGEKSYEGLTNLALLLAIHSNSSHDEVEAQLGGVRLFYMDDLTDLNITVEDTIASLGASLEDTNTLIDNNFAGLFSRKNLFDGLDITNKFLANNGVVTADATYEGYLTDYIRVSPGEVLFVRLLSHGLVSGWGLIWGYSDNKGSDPTIITSVSSNVTNNVYFVPTDGSVKFIRACSRVLSDGSVPFLSGSSVLEFITDKVAANKAATTPTTQFLTTGGFVTSDSTYSGYLTGYIPVKPGEKYYIKGAFPYDMWEGNIYAYVDKSMTDAVCLGRNYAKGDHTIVEIPEGYSYIRVCARADVTPHFAVIKMDDVFNSITADLLYQYWLDNNEAVSKKLAEGYAVNNIHNGTMKLYSTVVDIQESALLVEKNEKEDYFIYKMAGMGNAWLWTNKFYPTGNNLIHIRGKAEFISKGNGCSVLIANQPNANGKYKNIGTVTNDGEFDIIVDTSYLIAHEGYTDGFFVWWNNMSMTEGVVEVKVSNFQVMEFEEAVNAVNISGDNAKELFESVDENISDLKSQVEGSRNELISPSGNKYRMTVTDTGSIVAIPLIPNKAAFFGNSLIGGFGEYGMAASQAEKDYYYLITEYIKTVNPRFTAKSRMGASLFEGLTTTDETTVNGNIKTVFTDKLDGDEDLVVIQLGDNVNTDEKNVAFHTTCAMALKAIRQKCPNARVIWMGMWYASTERYGVIRDACNQTGCEYIFFDGLNTSDAQNVIGGLTYHVSSASRSITNVTGVVENSPTNITATFTVGGSSYSVTMDVDSYTPLSGTTLNYVGHYQVIQSGGVASHPGDEGFRRIANRFLYQTGLSSDEETYQ